MVLSIKDKVEYDLSHADKNDRMSITTNTGRTLRAGVKPNASEMYSFVLEPHDYPDELLAYAKRLAERFSEKSVRYQYRDRFTEYIRKQDGDMAAVIERQLLEEVQLIVTDQPIDRRRAFHRFHGEPLNLGLELVGVLTCPYYQYPRWGVSYSPRTKLDIPNLGQSPLLWYSGETVTALKSSAVN